MADWSISKTSGQCSKCNKEIEDGEQFFAALTVCDDGFERIDTCAECWEADKPEVFYFWKTKRLTADEQNKPVFIDDDMLLDFFDSLEDAKEQEKINFRFVLMLIMMRKRLLRYNTTDNLDGQELWKLKVTGQKREVCVVNPHLSEDEIEKLSDNIGQIMQMGDE